MVMGVSFVQKLPELTQKFVQKDSQLEKLYIATKSLCLLKRTKALENGIYMLGGISDYLLNKQETATGYDPRMTKFPSFSSIMLQQDVIYGFAYNRMTKCDNPIVSYCSNGEDVSF